MQECRNGSIEEIAVHYVRTNRVDEEKAKRTKQPEDNVRSAELGFMLDLETIIKETIADPDLIELNCCIEDNNTKQSPHHYRIVAEKLTHRWGIIMGHCGIKVTTTRSPKCTTFRSPRNKQNVQRRSDILVAEYGEYIDRNSKTCSACLNSGKNLKLQIPQTEKSKVEPPKTPREEIQIDFTGNLHNKNYQPIRS